MTASAIASDMPESANGHLPPSSGNSMNLATRHLCAVTHMRRFMLTEESFESDSLETPPRRWVGRAYALSVLVDDQRTGPMPGVAIGKVKQECWSAVRQTLLRDAAAIAVVAMATIFAPWGTFAIVGLIAVVIALAGRVKIWSPPVLAAAILLTLISGGPKRSDLFTIPLVALGLCFFIYVADAFWASRRVRAIMRRTAEASGPQSSDATDASRRRSKVLYGKKGILGAGTPLTPVTLTVAVDKPQEGKSIDPFEVSGLLERISAHIESQGTINHASDGFAHRRVRINGEWRLLSIPEPQGNGSNPLARQLRDQGNEAFTHGLPNLDVGEVVAVPGPSVRLRPFWWIVAKRLLLHAFRAHHTQAPDADDASAPSNSPSVFPERRYVRASTATWDGELIASVYVSAALQAHYLRLIIRPYILAPMVPHLRQIEDIARQNALVQLAVAVRGTVQSFFEAAVAANNFWSRRDKTDARRSKRAALLSTRERYAMSDTDSVHHQEDARRIFQVMEMKIFDVTEAYLEEHNVDTEDYKKQIQVFIEKSMIITGGENSGNFSIGDMNKQQQGSPNGPARGNGDGNGR